MGALVALGSVMAAWRRVDVFVDPLLLEATAVGRFRNARHAGEVRQRPSSDSLIARRYCSKPQRRSSRKRSFETVLENHVFGGRGAGGGAFVWEMRLLWKVVKSEYRLGTVKERSGRRREM
jgi:hypothetical protein